MQPTQPTPESVPCTEASLVLLVDDEPSVRRVGARALEAAGLRIVTAQDGLEAVEIYRERQSEIALVILDMTMPKLGGVETFQALSAINPDVRVILSSGYESGYAAQSFGDRGPVGYVQKPYRLMALVDAVKRSLLPTE
jgi:DNA-binding NtrC family response regulator